MNDFSYKRKRLIKSPFSTHHSPSYGWSILEKHSLDANRDWCERFSLTFYFISSLISIIMLLPVSTYVYQMITLWQFQKWADKNQKFTEQLFRGAIVAFAGPHSGKFFMGFSVCFWINTKHGLLEVYWHQNLNFLIYDSKRFAKTILKIFHSTFDRGTSYL